MEDNSSQSIQITDSDEFEVGTIEKRELPEVPKEVREASSANGYKDLHTKEDNLISCLRNERIIVRLVKKASDNFNNPKHVFYGGMADTATKSYTVPVLTSGVYKNVLTDSEKDFLEYILGFEKNALSIYKKNDNFWDNFLVTLNKEDNYLDLRVPLDYIKYKVLLANNTLICPSLEVLNSRPKASYRYVMFSEEEVSQAELNTIDLTATAFMEFGSIMENKDKMRLILETIRNRPIAPTTKIDWVKAELGKIIQTSPKQFLKVIKDPYLEQKILLKKAIEKGLLTNREGFYFDKATGIKLCLEGEQPTINSAAKFLSLPRNDEYRFTLEAKLAQE